ncbi:hypothetical protein F5X68DRAFT_260542 [Plectosphaerella plurivora]|uniref:Uncharacterized protein n=1 Tax=Plectosphaerella plurivora TaxID=936078 RepID=A0A9P8VE40_9PEZI|nr:hypothetical protein F5X68DRAFT_260542 [Plectosphaerella plurivora]
MTPLVHDQEIPTPVEAPIYPPNGATAAIHHPETLTPDALAATVKILKPPGFRKAGIHPEAPTHAAAATTQAPAPAPPRPLSDGRTPTTKTTLASHAQTAPRHNHSIIPPEAALLLGAEAETTPLPAQLPVLAPAVPANPFPAPAPSPPPARAHRPLAPLDLKTVGVVYAAVGAAARVALQAGAQAAYKLRNDPSPWVGEKGVRVASAALGAGIVDGIVGNKHSKMRKGGMRHQAMREATQFGLRQFVVQPVATGALRSKSHKR